MALPSRSEIRIGVVGLGYVGLPLAAYLGLHFPVVGFDIDDTRIEQLKRGVDRTNELTKEEFAGAKQLSFSANAKDLALCNFYIVTVPTPIDDAKRPDLGALIAASRTVGSVLSKGNVVVYEFDGLSGRDGRGLRPGAGGGLRPDFQQGLFRRLFA